MNATRASRNGFVAQPTGSVFAHARAKGVDLVLALVVATLAMIGLVMVLSAAMTLDASRVGDPYFHGKRHLVWLGIAGVSGLIVWRVPLAVWRRAGPYLLIAAIGLLVLVLIPGVGRRVNGSTRWLGVGGVTLQVSEFAKVAVLLYLSGYLVRHRDRVQTEWSGFLHPMLVLGVVVFLLISEPDFGSVVVLMGTVLGLFFLAGVAVTRFLTLVVGSLFLGVLMVWVQPYRLARIRAYQDPWANQYDSGYQLTQSLIAFGRGEWWGLGLGNGVQKLLYLPEPHTDFVFAVIGEETGLIGSLVVLGLFVVLVCRGLWIGRQAEAGGQGFNAYLAYSIALLLGIQSLINLGVCTGLLPTKGLTLPFVSYGGSSLLVCGVLIGLLQRVYLESNR